MELNTLQTFNLWWQLWVFTWLTGVYFLDVLRFNFDPKGNQRGKISRALDFLMFLLAATLLFSSIKTHNDFLTGQMLSEQMERLSSYWPTYIMLIYLVLMITLAIYDRKRKRKEWWWPRKRTS